MIYLVRKTDRSEMLSLDWENPGWGVAETAEIKNFRPESSSHQPQTSVRLLHDDEGIHGLFRVQDRFVRSVRTEYGSEVWKDSCVEFFAQPKPDAGYLNFEFNGGGVFLCSHIVDPTRTPDGFKDFSRVPATVAQEIQVRSTLPRVVEPEISEPTTWMLKFFIPFGVFARYCGALDGMSGATWRGNFFKCVEDNSHPHWAAWSAVDEFNFHLPRCFGEIRFE